MSPVSMLAEYETKRFPRVSGDEPGNENIHVLRIKFSPRERG